MTPIVITGPNAEPITLAEAKAHVRQVFDDEDAYITALITAARVMVEKRTGRAMMPQRVRIGMDAFCPVFRLPVLPLAATDGLLIQYTDPDGNPQTVNSTAYTINRYVEPVEVSPVSGASWPTISPIAGGVTLEYDVGYADAASVPAPLKQWMLLALGALYANREQVYAGAETYALPEDFMGLLWQPYMVYL